MSIQFAIRLTGHDWPIRPYMSKQHVVILSAGGMTSLIAAGAIASQADPPAMTFVHFADGHGVDSARSNYAARQASHFDARFVELELGQVDSSQVGLPTLAEDKVPTVTQSRGRLLLAGLGVARRLGVERVVWAAQFNGDIAKIATASEQVIVVQQLAELSDENCAAIDTPFMSLTDQQLVELGAHLSVPWDIAWTCTQRSDQPCQTCSQCNSRWASFDEIGIVDPSRESPQFVGAV
jgi:7-cyano-7-deazaguanine synthase in queuosine biosynthesis